MYVKAKKGLGQHFLKDENIARKIVEALNWDTSDTIIEVGPGTGVLTKFILEKNCTLKLVEIDSESIEFLKTNFPKTENLIVEKDFLKLNLSELGEGNLKVIGNFPYYISSQIFFKVLDYKDIVTETVGMIQREVARRIASKPGTKEYGILSVLMQAFYNIEYLFTVHENVFSPPPKVKSAVIRFRRNKIEKLECDEVLFRKVVKATFNQRRKTIRNSLKSILVNLNFDHELLTFRPEQLTVNQFVELTSLIEKNSELNQA
jgi:16S rRNA (adenine1518-N6/adenine1519-N6)-dimethyltransferase